MHILNDENKNKELIAKAETTQVFCQAYAETKVADVIFTLYGGDHFRMVAKDTLPNVVDIYGNKYDKNKKEIIDPELSFITAIETVGGRQATIENNDGKLKIEKDGTVRVEDGNGAAINGRIDYKYSFWDLICSKEYSNDVSDKPGLETYIPVTYKAYEYVISKEYSKYPYGVNLNNSGDIKGGLKGSLNSD